MNDWHTMQPPAEAAAPVEGSPEWIAERDKRLLAWKAAQDQLAAAKELEMSLREGVGEFVFPTDKRKSGVNNHDLGNGYTLKLGHKLNYNLVGKPETSDRNADVEAAMDRIEALGNEGAFLADRLIKWKPELSVSEYKELDADNPTHKAIKAIIDEILEIKPGAPSLEIREPKAKK